MGHGDGPILSHGDSGRALTKAQKQIEQLELKLKTATGKQAKAIKQKIQNIRETVQGKQTGETHHRR